MNKYKYYNYDFINPIHRIVTYTGTKKDRKNKREYYNPIENNWTSRKPTEGKKYKKWKSENFKIKDLYTPKRLTPKRIDRTRKIDNIYNLESNYATTDAIQYIFHSLFYLTNYKKDDDLVCLSSRYLKDVLGGCYNYSLEYIIKKGWVLCDDEYHFDKELPDNSYGRTYAINPKFISNDKFNFSKHPPVSFRLNNRLLEKEKEFNKLTKIKNTHKSIISMAKTARFDIDSFKREVDQGKIGKKKGYEISLALMEKLNQGELNFTNKITKTERCYTTFTRVIREARPYTYFDSPNNKLVDLDISSSQYWFLGQLSNNKFFNEILIKPEKNSTKIAQYREFKLQIGRVKNTESFKRFIADTCNGVFYENIVADFNSKCQLTGEIIDRNQAKDIAMEAIFSNKYYNLEQKNIIRSLYPAVIDLVESISFGINETLIVTTCQTAEARFMLDHYCQSLFHSNQTRFVTVHDSVMVEQKGAAYSVDLFFQECDKFGIRHPIFKNK